MRLVSLNYLNASVRASAIDNDVYQVRVLLPDDGQDRLLQVISLVKRWRDDSDAGEVHVALAAPERSTRSPRLQGSASRARQGGRHNLRIAEVAQAAHLAVNFE